MVRCLRARTKKTLARRFNWLMRSMAARTCARIRLGLQSWECRRRSCVRLGDVGDAGAPTSAQALGGDASSLKKTSHPRRTSDIPSITDGASR